jgi:LCP family protein required for cell wall assembly
MSLTTEPAAAPPAAPSPADGTRPPDAPTPRGWRHSLVLRVALGCVVVLLSAAGITVTFVLEQVHSLQQALGQQKSVQVGNSLAPTAFGGAETLLLVGNDQRKHTTTTPVLPHSNEMLMVRIDPGLPYISMMSIPRELEVTIYPPNQPTVITRLNYAYTAGGIPLLVSTIKRVTGLGVNHVVVIDFNQFKRAVDDLGCVYSTIDRRYFHVNTPTSEQYQEINLQPGYQQLCGTQALEFVSYRHGDTSLVRDARDQSFLLDVKKQYGPTLINNIGRFERIFGRTVQTDPGLKTTDGLLNLIGTLIQSATLRVRQVHFQVNLVPAAATPCECVTATQQQIQASVYSFLHGHSPRPGANAAAIARAVRNKHTIARLPLAATGRSEAARARRAGRGIPFPYEYPRVQMAAGASLPVDLRNYLIRMPDHNVRPIYVDVFSAGQLGQYYDVQGSTWNTAPQFSSPDQTILIGGRAYNLYYSGQHLNMVAWDEHGAVYWVHNSLTDALSNGEMLAIAEQTRPVTGVGSARTGHLSLKAARLPSRILATATASLRQKIGEIAGLVALLLLPLALVLVLRRRSLLRTMHEDFPAHVPPRAWLAPAMAPRAIAAPGAEVPLDFGSMHVYSSRGILRRRWQKVVAGVVLAGICAATAVVIVGAEAGPSRTNTARRHRVVALPPPTVPVAVLNATPTQDAAHHLAERLAAHGTNVSTVGNVASTRGAGLWVLYAPGDQAQAERVVRLLVPQAAKLAPIAPVEQAAAGGTTNVVVEIG